MRVTRRVLGILLIATIGLATAACGGGTDDNQSPPNSETTSEAMDGSDGMDESMDDSEAMDEAMDEATEVPETLAFTASTVDGGEFDGADVAGTPVAFWFWAAWCSRCAAAAGDLRDVQAEYSGRVEVVGVAGLGSGTDGMRAFVDQHQLGDFPHLADDTGEVWQRFGVTAQEYYVILDASGAVVHEGAMSADALRDRLSALAG